MWNRIQLYFIDGQLLPFERIFFIFRSMSDRFTALSIFDHVVFYWVFVYFNGIYLYTSWIRFYRETNKQANVFRMRDAWVKVFTSFWFDEIDDGMLVVFFTMNKIDAFCEYQLIMEFMETNRWHFRFNAHFILYSKGKEGKKFVFESIKCARRIMYTVTYTQHIYRSQAYLNKFISIRA